MTPTQAAMCHVIKEQLGRFYENPENERRFQEWKKEREASKQNRAPSECRQLAGKRHVNLTASAI